MRAHLSQDAQPGGHAMQPENKAAGVWLALGVALLFGVTSGEPELEWLAGFVLFLMLAVSAGPVGSAWAETQRRSIRRVSRRA